MVAPTLFNFIRRKGYKERFKPRSIEGIICSKASLYNNYDVVQSVIK